MHLFARCAKIERSLWVSRLCVPSGKNGVCGVPFGWVAFFLMSLFCFWDVFVRIGCGNRSFFARLGQVDLQQDGRRPLTILLCCEISTILQMFGHLVYFSWWIWSCDWNIHILFLFLFPVMIIPVPVWKDFQLGTSEYLMIFYITDMNIGDKNTSF